MRRGTKKSGKDGSSPTDFLHFKDFPRPLNQKYYGATYLSKKNAHVSSEYIHSIGPFYISQQKKKRGGVGYQALNSQAIKQAMPARNAGIGDCSAAHPSISACLRVCVSTMHVLPWAPTPHTGPSGLWGERRQVCYPLAALLPSPPHVPLNDSFFLPPAGNQNPWSSSPRPSYALGIPQSEYSLTEGLLSSSCSLCCVKRLVLSLRFTRPRL